MKINKKLRESLRKHNEECERALEKMMGLGIYPSAKTENMEWDEENKTMTIKTVFLPPSDNK